MLRRGTNNHGKKDAPKAYLIDSFQEFRLAWREFVDAIFDALYIPRIVDWLHRRQLLTRVLILGWSAIVTALLYPTYKSFLP